MQFSLETLTYISIFLIGGLLVVSGVEREFRKEIRELKERLNDLEQ